MLIFVFNYHFNLLSQIYLIYLKKLFINPTKQQQKKQQYDSLLFNSNNIYNKNQQIKKPKNMNDNNNNHKGLIYCTFASSQNSDQLSYCWLKLCQLLISTCFIFACILQLYHQIKFYGKKIQWRIFIIIFMVASLLANIIFCLWNELYILLYYLTLIGYVFRLYMRKNLWDINQTNNKIFIIVIVVLGLLETSILIDSIVQGIKNVNNTYINQSCQQTWYLYVNVICLIFCFLTLGTLYCNQKEEKEKFLVMSYQNNKIKNPFFQLWCWIGFNTLAQVVNLIQSGLLIGTSFQDQCLIIKDSKVWNNILRFFFSIFTLTAGYAATLIYFRHVRQGISQLDTANMQNSVDHSSNLSSNYGVQLFNNVLQGFEV